MMRGQIMGEMRNVVQKKLEMMIVAGNHRLSLEVVVEPMTP